MVLMAPMQHGFGIAAPALNAQLPSIYSSISHAAGIEAMDFQALPNIMLETNSVQPPSQYSMRSDLSELPQTVLLYGNGTNAAWNQDMGASFEDFGNLASAATERWSLTQEPEEFQIEPEEWHIETSANPDVVGVSKSTLRRRRRQRAAARVPEEAAADANSKLSSEEQALELVMEVRTGGEAQRSAIARFRRLAFSSQESSRVAQLALEDASPNEAVVLIKSLRGHVREATKSMYCNYVIQRAVELMPGQSISFIPHELLGVGRDVARHRFGCRILCRLLEHSFLEDDTIQALFEEVLRDADALSYHAFGNFVIRHCLEFGLAWHRRAIAFAVSGSLIEAAMDQNGSHVIESCVEFCESTDTSMIADVLLSSPEHVHHLATHNYGRHAVKAFLRKHGEWQRRIAGVLHPSLQNLRESKQGKPVLQALQAFEALS
jgi:hypothetical protein